jgi:Zn-dependent peptidase ImmA (M78 family)
LDSRKLSPAKILAEFCITEPEEIDVEAIAQYFGATVIPEPLHGSAARIIGKGDRAFITVNSRSPRARQRFSIAHELGHWMIDRGKLSGFVCTEKNLVTGWSADNPERRANRFAADLLMPSNLFAPAAKNKEMTFATVRDLCSTFETSLTATAIRLVENGSFPAMVVCSTEAGVKWKFRDRDISEEIQLRDRPGAYTNAVEVLSGRDPERNPAEVQASDWFTHPRSKNYSIIEDSVRIFDGTVLSLLWWKNEQQLLDLAED